MKKILILSILVLLGWPHVSQANDLSKTLSFVEVCRDAASKFVDKNDGKKILQFVKPYPETKKGFDIIRTNDGCDLEIHSKAAAFYLMGVNAVFQNSKMAAAWCFLEAAHRNPKNALYLNNAAYVLMEFGLFAKAEDILLYAKNLDPSLNQINVNLGFVNAKLEKFDQAALHYISAWLKNPSNNYYYSLIIHSLERTGEESAYQWISDFLLSIENDSDGTMEGAFLDTSNLKVAYFSEYFDAYNALLDMLAHADSRVTEYVQNVSLDMINSAEEAYRGCYDRQWTFRRNCFDDPGLSVDFCHCRYDPPMEKCKVVRDKVFLQDEIIVAALYTAEYNSILAQFPQVVERYDLTQSEIQQLEDTVVANIEESLALIRQDVQSEKHNYRNSVQDYNESILFNCSRLSDLERWVLMEELSASVEEGSFCFGLLCISYDAESGDLIIKGSAAATVQLSIDPFERSLTGVTFGLGGEYGLGPVSAEGGVYYTISEGRRGFEVKGAIGSTAGRVGEVYFYGLERIQGAVHPLPHEFM